MGSQIEESEGKLSQAEAVAWDREDFLAYARLTLALVCLIAAYLNPSCLGRNGDLSRLLILLYFAYGLLNLVVTRFHWHYGTAWVFCLHAADVVIVSLIMMSTGEVQSTFLGLYVFVFLAAACEWGLNGALATSAVCVIFLFSGYGAASTWSAIAPVSQFSGSRLFATVALSAGLVSTACFLGVLVDLEQKRYGDGIVIARLIRSAIPEPSFKEALGNTLKSLRQYFDADQVRLDLHELRGEQSFAWNLTRQTGETANNVRSWKLTESVRQVSFPSGTEKPRRGFGRNRGGADGEFEEPSAGGQQRPGLLGWVFRMARLCSSRKRYDRSDELNIVSEEHSPFVGSWSMLSTSFAFEGKWLGRLTVYNPRRVRNAHTGLRFLETLVREVGPAIFNKFMVARLRSHAQARERVRLVQELHDGIVQSLIGLEMQIEYLRRTQASASDPAILIQELGRLQALVHDEVTTVREEMQRIKPLQVEPGRLIDYIAATVDKFQREQGIAASFVAETRDVSLSPGICTELARIVQESLVNVRKHSGARKVVVGFGRENGHYKLVVDDDGRGFGFTGLLSPGELDSSCKCPSIVRERVRAIGGKLRIGSNQSSGARLEILVPVKAHGRISIDS